MTTWPSAGLGSGWSVTYSKPRSAEVLTTAFMVVSIVVKRLLVVCCLACEPAQDVGWADLAALEQQPASGDGGAVVGAADRSGGDELIGHAQFVYAHGDQGVAGGVAAEHGDVAGEPGGGHAPGQCAEQSADVTRVDRTCRRISR